MVIAYVVPEESLYNPWR